MLKTCLVLCVVAILLGQTAPAATKLRVLLLSGQNNHDWKATTPAIAAIFEHSGQFEVKVVNDVAALKPADLAKCDVIVSNWNTFGGDRRLWDAAMEKAFLEFVSAGKGLVVIHAGGSSFYGWKEFHQLAASWGKTTNHGPIHEFEVKISDAGHPVTKGLADFKIRDELWHNTDFPAGSKTLASAVSEKAAGPRQEPVLTATQYGKGRSINLILGHDATVMANPSWQRLLLRGTQWAATGTVTIPATAASQPSQTQPAVEGAK